jgi:hypothetical protein
MAINYYDLITTEELERDSLESLSNLDLQTNVEEFEAIVGDVTDTIDSYLDRGLIVKPYTKRYKYEDWKWDYSQDRFYAWAHEWPVVQITSTTSSFTLSDDKRRLFSESPVYAEDISYFAGYRRADQSLSDLQAVDGLSALTTLPALLPRDIRRAAIKLAVFEIQIMITGMTTRMDRTQRIAGGNIDLRAPITDQRPVILNQIRRYRRMIVG